MRGNVGGMSCEVHATRVHQHRGTHFFELILFIDTLLFYSSCARLQRALNMV